MKKYAHEIINQLIKIKEQRPLIHNITNWVVMHLTANSLSALGASPIMAHALGEIEEVVKQSNALVINIGTLDQAWVGSMFYAMQIAKKHNIPIVFDPVGAGATPYRTETSIKLIEASGPTVIRGNASEILSLAGGVHSLQKGVDSLQSSDVAYEAAMQLAKRYQCTVVISGPVDFIISETAAYQVLNGCEMMRHVSGMGCTATAIIAAFCAINENSVLAASYAMAVMGLAGESAMQKAQGPGSFQMHFLDTLFHLREMDIAQQLQLLQL